MPSRGEKLSRFRICWERMEPEEPPLLPVLVAPVPQQGRELLRVERSLLCTEDIGLRHTCGWRLLPANPTGTEAVVLEPAPKGIKGSVKIVPNLKDRGAPPNSCRQKVRF